MWWSIGGGIIIFALGMFIFLKPGLIWKLREWINNVQTVDDAITVLNQRIVTLPHIYVPYMCHIRAFLYAKNNDIDNAIESIKQGYENSEIPQVIIDKLVQIANG